MRSCTALSEELRQFPGEEEMTIQADLFASLRGKHFAVYVAVVSFPDARLCLLCSAAGDLAQMTAIIERSPNLVNAPLYCYEGHDVISNANQVRFICLR
jgi:hypothetical protein